MPPQQGDSLLGFVDYFLDFGSHNLTSSVHRSRQAAIRSRAFPLLFESRKRSMFLFLDAFSTENRCALFLKMLKECW
jgi:hypothetical protein